MKSKIKIILITLISIAIIGCDDIKESQAVPVMENKTTQNTVEVEKTPPAESNENNNAEPKKAKIDTESNKSENVAEDKPKTTKEKPKLILGVLKNVVSDGCSCSANHVSYVKHGRLFIADLDQDSPAYLNVNGVDTKFKLKKSGKRPDVLVKGSTYEDIYEADGMTATIKHIAGKSDCPDEENCESRSFTFEITVKKDDLITRATGIGNCGC